MKQLTIKFFITLFLSMLAPIFCFGNTLAELIDKGDFVNFKKAYEPTNVSEEEKAELLDRVDAAIKLDLETLKPFLGSAAPVLKVGRYQFRFPRYIFLIFSGIFMILTIPPVFMACEALRKKRDLPNQFNKTAAAYALLLPLQQYLYDLNLARAKAQISSNFIKAGFLAIGSGLSSVAFGWFAKWLKSGQISYKRYRKSLQIKELIQESIIELGFVENVETIRY